MDRHIHTENSTYIQTRIWVKICSHYIRFTVDGEGSLLLSERRKSPVRPRSSLINALVHGKERAARFPSTAVYWCATGLRQTSGDAPKVAWEKKIMVLDNVFTLWILLDNIYIYTYTHMDHWNVFGGSLDNLCDGHTLLTGRFRCSAVTIGPVMDPCHGLWSTFVSDCVHFIYIYIHTSYIYTILYLYVYVCTVYIYTYIILWSMIIYIYSHTRTHTQRFIYIYIHLIYLYYSIPVRVCMYSIYIHIYTMIIIIYIYIYL